MTKGEFYQTIEQFIMGMLPEKYADCTPVVMESVNQTGTYVGLMLQSEAESQIAPVINLTRLYEEHGNKEHLEMLMAVANEVTDVYDMTDRNTMERMQTAAVHMASDYEYAKEHLYLTMASMARKEVPANEPCHQIGDLQIQVRILIAQNWIKDEGIHASIVVRDDILKKWDKTFDEVYAVAVENTQNIVPTTIQTMGNVLNMVGIDELSDEMFDAAILIVGNKAMNQGAVNLFLPGVMEEISAKVGGSYIVLPSSVHEVIVQPLSMVGDELNEEIIADTEAMIQDVNNSQVLPEDRLSDHAYFYDADRKEFCLASEALAVRKEAAAEYVKQEKKLQENTDDVSKKNTDTMMHPNF